MTFSSRRWPEHDLIEKEYPRRGRHWIAKRIGRSPDVVHAYARRHGLELGDVPNHVRINELAELTGQRPHSVWQRAKTEGVLRRFKADTKARNTIAAVVPIEWADAYAAEITTRAAGEELRETDGWLTTYQLTDLWKVGKGTVLRGLNGKGVLAPLLEDARTTRGLSAAPSGRWLMHPSDAQRIAERLDADRQKAKRLISTKSIAIEENVMQSYAADIGRELGGELLFVHGRLMCHVTPQVAKAMRRRFRETKGLTPRTPRPNKHTPPKRCTVCGQLFHRRQALTGQPGYESPGSFNQRKTCGPTCHQKQSRMTRYGAAHRGLDPGGRDALAPANTAAQHRSMEAQ
ncbi:MAG: hypothetical protein WDA15_06270 [Trueperaceae bacterium]